MTPTRPQQRVRIILDTLTCAGGRHNPVPGGGAGWLAFARWGGQALVRPGRARPGRERR